MIMINPNANIVFNSLGADETVKVNGTAEGEVPDSKAKDDSGFRKAPEEHGIAVWEGQLARTGSNGFWGAVRFYGDRSHLDSQLQLCGGGCKSLDRRAIIEWGPWKRFTKENSPMWAEAAIASIVPRESFIWPRSARKS
jgi:hypothetical protein